ncbi:MAG: VWA domain-containing protein [Pyrinomonadaceae bacterium]
MPRKASALLGLLIAGIAVFVVGGQNKNAPDVYKVDTRLISVPVIVSDRDGRYIPNLTAKDFSVFQDGIKQNIEFFGATEEPLTIALLIDTSQSTRPVLDDIKDSAYAFLKLLLPRDRAMVVSFDYDTHVLSEITSDKEQLRQAIRRADVPDDLVGTTMRDAAFQTVNRSFAGIKGRKAVIILTDGKDHGSRISRDELLYSLQESDALIYTIMFKTGAGQGRGQMGNPGAGRRDRDIFGGIFRLPDMAYPGRGNQRRQNRPDNQRRAARVGRVNEEAQEFLQALSDSTAGRFFSSEDGKLKKTFESIVEELRFQYRLGFYPQDEADEKTLHELKVKVGRTDASVRSRSSYRTK